MLSESICQLLMAGADKIASGLTAIAIYYQIYLFTKQPSGAERSYIVSKCFIKINEFPAR